MWPPEPSRIRTKPAVLNKTTISDLFFLLRSATFQVSLLTLYLDLIQALFSPITSYFSIGLNYHEDDVDHDNGKYDYWIFGVPRDITG